jgi:hypothetical protein
LTLNIIAGIKDMVDLMNLRIHGEPATIERDERDRRLVPRPDPNPNAGEKLFHKYLDILRDSWGRYDGQWPGVERKLELRMASLPEGRSNQPREMVKELHNAFGGELWIDGRLCYKRGKEILQPFKRTCYGEWQIAWFQPDNPIIWGKDRRQIAAMKDEERDDPPSECEYAESNSVSVRINRVLLPDAN